MISAGVVYLGTAVAHLTVAQFAMVNVVLTLAWMLAALAILRPRLPRIVQPRVVNRTLTATAASIALLVTCASTARAQDSRDAELAQERARKASDLHPYEPPPLERRIEMAEHALMSRRPVYAFIGSVFEESGIAIGPGYRGWFADSGAFDVHAALSIRNYKSVDAFLKLPSTMNGRLTTTAYGEWLDAPTVSFYGIGNDSSKNKKATYAYQTTTAGSRIRIQAPGHVAFGADVASVAIEVGGDVDPSYIRTMAFAEYDSRTSPTFTHRGTLYRAALTEYRQTNAGASGFSAFRRGRQPLHPAVARELGDCDARQRVDDRPRRRPRCAVLSVAGSWWLARATWISIVPVPRPQSDAAER